MALPPPFVPNDIMTLAANLRYLGPNGILIEQQFPWDYINTIGNKLSSQIDVVNAINTVLVSQGTAIDNLETEVAQILASGYTMPSVNGQCLNGDTNDLIQNIVGLLVTNTCDYNEVLGTTTELSLAISAQCTNLNTEPAYSQNTAMAALVGWHSTVDNIGESLSNLWLSYCDMRAGVTQALEWSAPTCASIQTDLSGYYNPSTRELTVYLGAASMPSNFSDAGGSTIVVRDSFGVESSFAMDFDTVLAAGFKTVDLSASAVSQTSDYTVFFTWDVTSTTPALGCEATKVITVSNTTITCTPLNIVPSTTTAQFSFTPYITNNVVYTVELLTTSGTVVEATFEYVNPTTTTIGTFTNLTPASDYWIQLTVDIGGTATTCPIYQFETTS